MILVYRWEFGKKEFLTWNDFFVPCMAICTTIHSANIQTNCEMWWSLVFLLVFMANPSTLKHAFFYFYFLGRSDMLSCKYPFHVMDVWRCLTLKKEKKRKRRRCAEIPYNFGNFILIFSYHNLINRFAWQTSVELILSFKLITFTSTVNGFFIQGKLCCSWILCSWMLTLLPTKTMI